MSGSAKTRSRAAMPSYADFEALAAAARDAQPVTGLTHNFYRYPARFSPRFASAAIAHFSQPGDIVGDPYMGGGTAIVEAVAAGRHAVGNDLNELAAFITKVKVTRLSPTEVKSLSRWSVEDIPALNYRVASEAIADYIDATKTKNLSMARARFIKKIVGAALASIELLPTKDARDFAKCVVLRVGQWALDGRTRHTSIDEFRERLSIVANEMLVAIKLFGDKISNSGGQATLLNMDAASLNSAAMFAKGARLGLVVTSPPYPGVHVLYHRWQVDGRRETPAPYWITGCSDGKGASYYNFGDRREAAADNYFATSLRTLTAIRHVMRDGAYIVQMVAFNRPEDQLERYLANMHAAGFAEVRATNGRIWRGVPNRKWHATLKGKTNSSNEVVLVHRAV